MAKLPEPPPPAVLATVVPEVRTLAARTRIGRVYRAGGDHPQTWSQFRHWGPTQTNRFDHHLPDPATGQGWLQDRGILYGAARLVPSTNVLAVCIAEVYQESRLVDVRRGDPAFVVFAVARPLRLLDLTGFWALRAGASQVIASGRRDRARRWSQACYAAYPQIDGLLYPASMGGGEPSIALYERGADALPSDPLFHRMLDDRLFRDRLARAVAFTGYALL